jgi:hypothetical protein
MAEQLTLNQWVQGSSPWSVTKVQGLISDEVVIGIGLFDSKSGIGYLLSEIA